MKTIQKGTKLNNSYRTRCPRCDSLIEALEMELTWEADCEVKPLVARKNCPECGRKILFNKP